MTNPVRLEFHAYRVVPFLIFGNFVRILDKVFLHRSDFIRKNEEAFSIRYRLEYQVERNEADWMRSKSEQLWIGLLICKILKIRAQTLFFHKPELTMSASNSRQMLETKDDATAAVKRILDGNVSRFEMVPLDEYNKIAKLRSQH